MIQSAIVAKRDTATRHIRLYAMVWAGYFVLLAILPVQYSSLQALNTAFAMILWVGTSVLVAYVVHSATVLRGWTNQLAHATAGRPLRLRQLERLLWLSMGSSIVGLLCLIYDRVVIQGIDYTQGIAVARELWRRAGEERSGVSSIFSVMGYLLGFWFCAGTTLAHLHWEFLGRRMRRCVIVLAIMLVATNSLLSGGRSIVLIQLACVAATCCIRAILGRKMMPGRGVRIWIAGTLTLIISTGYGLYVFSARASTGNILPERYVTGMVEFLGGKPTDAFYRLNDLPAVVAGTAQFSVVAGAYLTHSYGTFESVLEAKSLPLPGTVSFGFIRQLLSKFGVGEDVTQDWLLSGRLLSLPGSLYYDFGWIGFYAGAVFAGMLMGMIPYVMGVRNGGGSSLMIVVIILITALLSPLVSAIDILSVPFLVLGFIEIDLINRLMRGGSNWLYVSRTVRPARLEGYPEAM